MIPRFFTKTSLGLKAVRRFIWNLKPFIHDLKREKELTHEIFL
jgi:hypothetical protein